MLVEVRNASDNALIGQYAYGGGFRRTTVTDSSSTVIHSYYNNNWRSVEERKDASTNPQAVYFWGAQCATKGARLIVCQVPPRVPG